MTAAEIAKALGGHRSGSQFMVCCPVHKDRTPSLAITDKGGTLLVKCYAGCDQKAVVAAFRDAGLWPESPAKTQPSAKGSWIEWQGGIRYPSDWGTPITEYRYRDQDGVYRYSIVRFNPKSFRQGYWLDGRWTWKKHPEQVLYRLDEVAKNSIIFVVEGEKDVETLREHGFIATTNAGGAKAPWLPQFTAALAGKEVTIIPDGDAPGVAHARTVALALLAAGTSATILELPEAKDVSDWFLSHSEVEFMERVERSHGYVN